MIAIKLKDGSMGFSVTVPSIPPTYWAENARAWDLGEDGRGVPPIEEKRIANGGIFKSEKDVRLGNYVWIPARYFKDAPGTHNEWGEIAP